MQSIAALGKQWAVVRTGERSTRDGKDLGPGTWGANRTRRLDWMGARPASTRASAPWTTGLPARSASPGIHGGSAQEGVSRQALRVDRSLAGYWRKTLNVAACACVSQPRRVLLLSSLLLLLLMEHSVVPAFSDHSLSAASSFRKERPTNRAARTREASTPRHRRSI